MTPIMSTIIPVLPSSVLPSGLSFVRSPTTHGFSLPKASYVSLSLYFLNLFSDSPKKGGKICNSNVYQTNFLTKQKTAEVTAWESP